MKKNVGKFDMIFRIIIGAILLAIGLVPNPIVSEGTPQMIVAVIAFIPLLTGILRFCPLYLMAGMSTYEGDTASE